MHKVFTSILIGYISFTGFVLQAQNMEDIEPIEVPVSAIEGPLFTEAPPPEVNLDAATVLDTKGRYSARWKINFTEFPLRSLDPTKHTGGGQNAPSETAKALAATLRIKNRLRLPQVDIAIEDRTAIVSGTVPTDRQRRLVEMILRFEPGIDTVQNRLTVAP